MSTIATILLDISLTPGTRGNHSYGNVCFNAFLTDTGSPQDPFAPQSLRQAYFSTGPSGYQPHGPHPESGRGESPFFKLKFFEAEPHVFGWCYTHNDSSYTASEHFRTWYTDQWIVPRIEAAVLEPAPDGRTSSRQYIEFILEKLGGLIEQYEDVRMYTTEVVKELEAPEAQGR